MKINLNTSSFMNLPTNKKDRKKVKIQRDTTNIQRTYDVVRSFMEDEYREQILSKKSIKDILLNLSTKKYLQKYQNK